MSADKPKSEARQHDADFIEVSRALERVLPSHRVLPVMALQRLHVAALKSVSTAVTECSDAKERDEGCFRAVRAENALRELVRLKEIKDVLDDNDAGVRSMRASDWAAMSGDYKTNKPLAWQRAREALASTPASAGADRVPEKVAAALREVCYVPGHFDKIKHLNYCRWCHYESSYPHADDCVMRLLDASEVAPTAEERS